MLNIRLARKGESGLIQSIYMESGELGEFVMKAGIDQRIAENPIRPGVWVAELDGEPVGAANIGSRASYPHLIRHGEVAVLRKCRRRRIGSALYLAEIAQAILEGRRQAEDTIIGDNPNMHGFLPYHGYRVIGFLEQRTVGFKDIFLYQKETLRALVLFLISVRVKWEDRFRIELGETEKVRENRKKNFENYTRHRPSLVPEFEGVIKGLLEDPMFLIGVTAQVDKRLNRNLWRYVEASSREKLLTILVYLVRDMTDEQVKKFEQLLKKLFGFFFV